MDGDSIYSKPRVKCRQISSFFFPASCAVIIFELPTFMQTRLSSGVLNLGPESAAGRPEITLQSWEGDEPKSDLQMI